MSAEPVLPADPPPDVVLMLAVRDGARVEVWTRQGCPGSELAAVLRQIADGFEHGWAVRVR